MFEHRTGTGTTLRGGVNRALPDTSPVSAPVPHPVGHVLIVEDEADMARFLRAALTRASVDSTVVTTGEAAILHLAKEPADLILLDIRLPGISGLDVCRRLKADPRLRHIPIIFVTVHHDHQMRAQAFSLGAAEYLTKPFQVEHFLACVVRQLALAAARQKGLPPAALLPPR